MNASNKSEEIAIRVTRELAMSDGFFVLILFSDVPLNLRWVLVIVFTDQPQVIGGELRVGLKERFLVEALLLETND